MVSYLRGDAKVSPRTEVQVDSNVFRPDFQLLPIVREQERSRGVAEELIIAE